MEKTILHIDCNKFYASVECLHHPEIRDKPVVVGGSEETRHGIVLTKNEIASEYGIQTAEPLWKARSKCPGLVVVPPNFPLYVRFSNMAKKIYMDYSDYIEPFGLDENWVDVTGSRRSGQDIAEEIRERVKAELGITVSIGVSWNKIFAKFGSDYKKPDAVTVINKQNFKDIVWNSPCNDLLFVGPATTRKLAAYGIYTIGDIAQADIHFLTSVFGKNGEILHNFSNGLDTSPVRHMDDERAVKSVGNSTTTPRDMVNNSDVKTVFTVLGESVARRMREQGLKGKTVTVTLRDKNLYHFTRQGQLKTHTDVSSEIIDMAMKIFLENYNWKNPLRSIGIAVSDFNIDEAVQFDLSGSVEKREKLEKLEKAVDDIRRRFGNYSVQRASLLADTKLSRFNPHDDHTIHPIGYFKDYKEM
ncbi:MAG: DNA polymerase IV [Eubacterium sp.]|nr:DNA polymerase IV [Eubacterium sp.]MDE6505763.1 DNA polymerase IV [Eubacterium sp.]